jgi:hypothetical protein
VRNDTRKEKSLTLEGKLSSWSGRNFTYPAIPATRVKVAAGDEEEVAVGPLQWGLGTQSYWWPNKPFRESYEAVLHNLKLELEEGKTRWHERTRRFGFVQFAEGPPGESGEPWYYTVNGVRVNNISDSTCEPQMSYFDTYSVAPAFLPPEEGEEGGCAETWRRYQRIGIDANRICCAIPTEYMMETADEAGFLLMPEGVTWGNDLSRYHDEYTPLTIREMARMSRAHPSVFRYSLTNEVRDEHGPSWPWRALIDAATEEDDTRPLVFEEGTVLGRVDGLERGHAYFDEHYGDIVKGGDIIRNKGEHFWETDGMEAFAIGSQLLRLYDWAYLSPWSFINYWPNFLEGMSHDQHGWGVNNAPDRRDDVNGWGSPIVRFLQKALDPYLLLDHDVLADNPPRPRATGDGDIEWPYAIPAYVKGGTVQRRVEVFNDALFGDRLSLKWSAHWDSADGPVAVAGETDGPFEVEPGFHATRFVEFEAPDPGKKERPLYLVMESVKDGDTVFREDRIHFTVYADADDTSAEFQGEDRETAGDWAGEYGAAGYDVQGASASLPGGASLAWEKYEQAALIRATWRARELDSRLHEWERSTGDTRALLHPDDVGDEKTRVAAARRGERVVLTIDTGDSPRKVTLYLLDWERTGSAQSVEIRDSRGAILDWREVSDFEEGVYLSWEVDGSVQIDIREMDGNAAVLSGIFFDPAD